MFLRPSGTTLQPAASFVGEPACKTPNLVSAGGSTPTWQTDRVCGPARGRACAVTAVLVPQLCAKRGVTIGGICVRLVRRGNTSWKRCLEGHETEGGRRGLFPDFLCRRLGICCLMQESCCEDAWCRPCKRHPTGRPQNSTANSGWTVLCQLGSSVRHLRPTAGMVSPRRSTGARQMAISCGKTAPASGVGETR